MLHYTYISKYACRLTIPILAVNVLQHLYALTYLYLINRYLKTEAKAAIRIGSLNQLFLIQAISKTVVLEG